MSPVKIYYGRATQYPGGKGLLQSKEGEGRKENKKNKKKKEKGKREKKVVKRKRKIRLAKVNIRGGGRRFVNKET